jgi:hypothetical protein
VDPELLQDHSELGSGLEDAPDKTATSDLFLRGATSFGVYARMDCSPIGFWERAQQLGAEALQRSEQHQVERIFATGSAVSGVGQLESVFPHLQADTAGVDTSGAALQTVADELSATTVDVVEGIGLIEEALGSCYHGQGVIHVPAILGAALKAYNLVSQRGAQLSSPAGHAIALGTGYPGGASDDGAVTPGIAWVYATGAVWYYRSAVTVHAQVDSFNRSKNTEEALAERRYVVAWDCCHFAVPISTGGVEAGGFGTDGAIGS